MQVDDNWRELYTELRDIVLTEHALLCLYMQTNNPGIAEEFAKSVQKVADHIYRTNDRMMALESISTLEEDE